MYSNGNHYDALINKDHPLLTMGTINEMEKKLDDIRDNEKKVDNLEIITDKDKLVKELQKQLKQSELSKLRVENLYKGAEEKIKEL